MAELGQILTSDTGSWTGGPTSYSYQWRRNGSNIGGATSQSYIAVDADVGTNVTVAVIATNIIGPSTAAVSENTPIKAIGLGYVDLIGGGRIDLIAGGSIETL